MKTTFLTLAVLAGLASAPTVRAQSSGDSAWNSQFAALDEEHAAQAGVAISIVFDDSGSMSEHGKMKMAKQAFRTWVADAPASYRFGLVALNAGKLVELKRDDKPEILAAVDRLQPSGDTPLADTIARVGREIRQRRAAGALYERQVVIILTDGEDNTRRGIKGVQDEINRLRADRVEVIAFGYQGEGDYMRDCATHFFSPTNGEDISRGLKVIAAEIGDTSDVVVDGATLARMSSISKSDPPAASFPVVPTNPAATAPPPAPPVTPVASPQATPSSAVSEAPARNSHWLRTAIVVAVVVLLFSRRGRRR